MVNVFQRSLKTGIVTKGYPGVPEPAPALFRGQVQIDPDACMGDEACARVCPAEAIMVERRDDGWTWSLTDARCVFCGLCAEVCDRGAIRMSNEFELATLRPIDLTTVVHFGHSSAVTKEPIS